MYVYIYIIGTWSNRDELSWPAQTHAQRLSVLHIFQQFQCLLDHLSTRFVFAKWKGLFFSFRNSWTGQRKKHPLCHPIYVFFSVIHQLCFFSVIHQHISMFFVQSPYYWINPDTGQLSIHKVNPSPTFCRWGRLLGRRSCRLATVREFAVAKTSLVGWAMGL